MGLFVQLLDVLISHYYFTIVSIYGIFIGILLMICAYSDIYASFCYWTSILCAFYLQYILC